VLCRDDDGGNDAVAAKPIGKLTKKSDQIPRIISPERAERVRKYISRRWGYYKQLTKDPGVCRELAKLPKAGWNLERVTNPVDIDLNVTSEAGRAASGRGDKYRLLQRL